MGILKKVVTIKRGNYEDDFEKATLLLARFQIEKVSNDDDSHIFAEVTTHTAIRVPTMRWRISVIAA